LATPAAPGPPGRPTPHPGGGPGQLLPAVVLAGVGRVEAGAIVDRGLGHAGVGTRHRRLSAHAAHGTRHALLATRDRREDTAVRGTCLQVPKLPFQVRLQPAAVLALER